MQYVANKNITISKGSRIVKGQTVKAFRAITKMSEPIMEIVISEKETFHMQLSLLNKFFTEIK